MPNKLAGLFGKGDRLYSDILKEYEGELLKTYLIALKNIKSKVASVYEHYGDKVTFDQMMQYNRLTTIEKYITIEIVKLAKDNIGTIKDAVGESFKTGYYYDAFVLEKTLGAKIGFGLLNPKVIESAIFNPLDRIKWSERLLDHADALVGRIKSEIAQGLIQGSGYGKIAEAITTKTDTTANQIIRIVRTETHRAQMQGKVLSFEKSEKALDNLGMKHSRVWSAVLDNRTRADHIFMDGKESDKDNKFYFPSGGETVAPGLSGIPAEDINCRCSIRLDIKGFEPTKRKDNETKNIIDYKDYAEWQKERLN